MKLQVVSVLENPDGSAEISFEIDKEYKDLIKNLLGMKRWNEKKFQQFVIDALTKQVSLEKRTQ